MMRRWHLHEEEGDTAQALIWVQRCKDVGEASFSHYSTMIIVKLESATSPCHCRVFWSKAGSFSVSKVSFCQRISFWFTIESLPPGTAQIQS